jgi:hypothetical protein
MRKLLGLLMAFAVLLTLAVVASAHDRHGREHGWNQGRRVRVIRSSRRIRPVRVVAIRRPARVLGVRYYNSRYDNYGRRRSALVHYRNAQRRALRRHQLEEWRRLRRHHGRVRW